MVSHPEERELVITGQKLVAGRLAVGYVLDGAYEIGSLAGQGGMCSVYSARHIQLDRQVAVKVLKPNLAITRESVERFRREAVAVASLDHPNIVRVFGFGTIDGLPYMVLELVEGRSFADLLRVEHRLSREVALPPFIQICDALDYAHNKGIVHRDLKPSNIMLVGESNDVKVLDFGIAKLTPDSGKQIQTLTQTGELFGTVAYMSPEQCLGNPVDARSDIYSLGCLMYEALTGSLPYQAETPFALMHKRLSEAPPESEMLSDAFGQVVLWAMEKEPSNRPQSARALKEALLHPADFLSRRKRRRNAFSNPMLKVGIAAFACAAIAGLGWLVWRGAALKEPTGAGGAKQDSFRDVAFNAPVLLDQADHEHDLAKRIVMYQTVRDHENLANPEYNLYAGDKLAQLTANSRWGIKDAQWLQDKVAELQGRLRPRQLRSWQMKANQCMFGACLGSHREADALSWYDKQMQFIGDQPVTIDESSFRFNAQQAKLNMLEKRSNPTESDRFARSTRDQEERLALDKADPVLIQLRIFNCVHWNLELVTILLSKREIDKAILEANRADKWLGKIEDPKWLPPLAGGYRHRADQWDSVGQTARASADRATAARLAAE